MRHLLFILTVISIVCAGTLSIAANPGSTTDIQQIKPEELKKLIEDKDPGILVVDNQPKGVYDLGHIKGAINFPWAMDLKSPGGLPRDKMLILYCDCAHSEDPLGLSKQLTGGPDSCSADDDATDVARQLIDKFGYRNIQILDGGWSKWKQLGYPVD
jgi:rhodanese-related sulfurtransferase